MTGGTRFRGPRIVTAGFTAQFVQSACTYHIFGVFVLPLVEEFDASRGVVALGFGLSTLTFGLAGPAVGRVADRGSVRAMMVAGVGVMAAGLYAMSRAESLWLLGLLFGGVVALGGAMCGPVVSMTLVGKWYVRRRGMALGLSIGGATVAGFVAPPLAAWLVNAYDWRTALVVLGASAVVIAVPVLLAFVVRRPEDVGQTPDGLPPEAPASDRSLPVSDAPGAPLTWNDPQLWIVALSFTLLYTCAGVINVHLIPYAQDLGIDRQRAALFFSCYAPFSLLGKLLFGAAADRVDPRVAVWGPVVLLLLTFGLLLSGPSFPVLLATGALFGLGIGAIGPLQGVVIGTCFGRAGFGRALGLAGLIGLPLTASAGPVSGWLFDVTGSYASAFGIQVGALLVAGALLTRVRLPASAAAPTPEPA